MIAAFLARLSARVWLVLGAALALLLLGWFLVGSLTSAAVSKAQAKGSAQAIQKSEKRRKAALKVEVQQEQERRATAAAVASATDAVRALPPEEPDEATVDRPRAVERRRLFRDATAAGNAAIESTR